MNKPKILFLDIETSPNLAWVWEKYEQNVIEFEKYWLILSFSAKWMGGKTITRSIKDYPGYTKNLSKLTDKNLVKELWDYFNEADAIVAHNGDEFDIKKSNARFSFHNLPPPEKYAKIDTLKIAKRYFKYPGNKLSDLAGFFGIGSKIEVHKNLWMDCLHGKDKAWGIMKEYNENDVVLLEKVYNRLLPWMKNNDINYGSFMEQAVCPRCGSKDLESRGYQRTQAAVYRRFRCRACLGWCQSSKLDHRIEILKPIA